MKKSIVAVAICAICGFSVNSVTAADVVLGAAPDEFTVYGAAGDTYDLEVMKFNIDIHKQMLDAHQISVEALGTIADHNTAHIKASEQEIIAQQTEIDTNKTNILGNMNYIQQNANSIAALNGTVAAKVDQSVFDAGQTSQDQAHAALVQRITLDEQYDGEAISQNRDGVAANATAIQSNAAVLNTHSTALQANEQSIQANAQGVQANTAAITATNSRVDSNTTEITATNKRVDTNTTAITATNKRVDTNTADISTNRQEIGKTNTRVTRNESAIANHESRISTLEANRGYGNSFKNLKDDVEKNRKNASRGIAGASALAGLPQLNQDQTFGVAAATGGYDGETAVAVGFSAHPIESNHNLIVKAGVTSAAGGDIGWNAGVGYGW